MKLVYISGKLTDKDKANTWLNILSARDVAELVVKADMGWAPIIMHTMTQLLTTGTEEYWLSTAIEVVSRCDGVLLMDNWRDSPGAKKENIEALFCGMPIRVLPPFPDVDAVKAELLEFDRKIEEHKEAL